MAYPVVPGLMYKQRHNSPELHTKYADGGYDETEMMLHHSLSNVCPQPLIVQQKPSGNTLLFSGRQMGLMNGVFFTHRPSCFFSLIRTGKQKLNVMKWAKKKNFFFKSYKTSGRLWDSLVKVPHPICECVLKCRATAAQRCTAAHEKWVAKRVWVFLNGDRKSSCWSESSVHMSLKTHRCHAVLD